MKKTLIILALLTATANFAQNAKKVLDEVSNKMKSYKTLYIEFNNNLDNKTENVHQKTKGNVSLMGEKYVINMLGMTTIFDGNKMYTINPEDEEVTISEIDEDDDLSPANFFTFYEEGYTFKLEKTENKNGRKLQYIRLVPIDSNAEFSYVILVIDTKTKHIKKLIQKGKNGTDITLIINKFKADIDLPSNLFKFDKKKYEDKGYLINEL